MMDESCCDPPKAKAVIPRIKMTKNSNADIKQLKAVLKQSHALPWWSDFCFNVLKQGWMSDKQRKKLNSFNYEAAMDKAYCVGKHRKSNRTHWSEGLDHDDGSDYTGESCSAEFFS